MEKSELGNLPEETVLEILTRLPVKSLLRFRCVSKCWCDSISRPKFTLSNPTKVVAFMDLEKESWRTYKEEGFSINPWDENVIRTFLASTYNHDFDGETVRLLASYNGLVLLSCDVVIYLLNPTTWRCKMVLIDYDLRIRTYEASVIGGICYDSSTDDYKVVIGLQGHGMTPGYGDLQVYDASLKTKTWKCIESPYCLHWQYNGPVVDEKIHWWVGEEGANHYSRHDDFSGYNLIIYFDAANDKFVELPMPEHSKFVKEYELLGLGVLEGCLAMTWHNYQASSVGGGFIIDIWSMEEYGVKESWTISFTIAMKDVLSRMEQDLWQPLLVANDGEVLMKVGYGRVMAYNPKEDYYRDVLLLQESSRSYDDAAMITSYEESLFFPSVDGQNLADPNTRIDETGQQPHYVGYSTPSASSKSNCQKRGNSEELNSHEESGEGSHECSCNRDATMQAIPETNFNDLREDCLSTEAGVLRSSIGLICKNKHVHRNGDRCQCADCLPFRRVEKEISSNCSNQSSSSKEEEVAVSNSSSGISNKVKSKKKYKGRAGIGRFGKRWRILWQLKEMMVTRRNRKKLNRLKGKLKRRGSS